MEFKVKIKEIISQTFTVNASSEEEALKMTVQNYKDSKFIVDNPTLLTAIAETSNGLKETIY